MTVEDMKTGFVERIGGTIFVVNAMPAENAKHTQDELVKALIAREAMALQEADVARLPTRHLKVPPHLIRSGRKQRGCFYRQYLTMCGWKKSQVVGILRPS